MGKKARTLLVALSLCLGLILPMTPSAHAAYIDVPENHWAADSIRCATELGLFQGVGNGSFGVGCSMTRAEFVTALGRLFRWEPVVPEAATYEDVALDAWYCSAVETAAANEALPSTGSRFRPSDPITREEMAVMLVRGLGYTSLAGAVSQEASPFRDVTTNRGFITVAYDLGIVSGIGDGLFAPKSTAVREQAAAMLVRVYDRLWAASYEMNSFDANTLLVVPTPAPDPKADMPVTPLEPLQELYSILRSHKASGEKMDTLTLQLTAGGVCTISSGGSTLDTKEFTKEEVTAVLSENEVRLYYSHRYESAYCMYEPNGYQQATLWYQSPESMAAKLKLARLFGVTRYVLA